VTRRTQPFERVITRNDALAVVSSQVLQRRSDGGEKLPRVSDVHDAFYPIETITDVL
jgi:hypothetical protein